MPLYSKLRILPGDSQAEKAEKKRISGNVLALREALKTHIEGSAVESSETSASRDTMRIGTWNLREFDNDKFGNRLPESFHYIAEIISHFDLVALQEIRGDLKALTEVMRLLGPQWEFIATDVAPGHRGNDERMAFVFNGNKVWFRKIAGELTLADQDRFKLPDTYELVTPDGVTVTLPQGAELAQPDSIHTSTSHGKTKISEAALVDLPAGTTLTLPAGCQLAFGPGDTPELKADKTLNLKSGAERSFSKAVGIRIPPPFMETDSLQFARTPFGVAFQAGWLKLMLCTVHIYYGADKGEKLERRNAEIQTLTKVLADRAKSDNDSDADSYFFVLGDFNIIGKNHITFQALNENDFAVPEALQAIPEGSNVQRDKAYDQIAVWQGKTHRRQPFKDYTRVEISRAGIFDYYKTVFRSSADDPGGADEQFYKGVIAEEQPKFSQSQTPWSYTTWRTYQMSDHLPMWIELRIDFSDDYLERIKEAP